jgi:hypothetical protein
MDVRAKHPVGLLLALLLGACLRTTRTTSWRTCGGYGVVAPRTGCQYAKAPGRSDARSPALAWTCRVVRDVVL